MVDQQAELWYLLDVVLLDNGRLLGMPEVQPANSAVPPSRLGVPAVSRDVRAMEVVLHLLPTGPDQKPKHQSPRRVELMAELTREQRDEAMGEHWDTAQFTAIDGRIMTVHFKNYGVRMSLPVANQGDPTWDLPDLSNRFLATPPY